ncbi:unnamed protein product [Cylicocyclus nassatus]|uniref:Uncharacterized protein n=1 Tax=Cylicocyclus nassatus TaxID=53992 RepID=A0AA36GYX9_CYLNA|nr:unnamed protein product [Cylicocyclus nassatus]
MAFDKAAGFRYELERIYKRFLNNEDSELDIPAAGEMLRELDWLHKLMLYSSIVPCVIVCLLGLFHVYFFMMYTSNEEIRSGMYYLVMMPPVTVATSLMAMFIPRSAGFLSAVTTTYYMICMFMIVQLMFDMYGCRRALARYLKRNRIKIKLAVPPYASYCTCLPEIRPRLRNILNIEACILQTVIVRIVLQILELIAYFELRHRHHVFFTISNLVNIISMYISLYFAYVLIEVAKDRLEPYRFALLFKIQDSIMSLPAHQKLILDLVVALDWIKNVKNLPASNVAMFYLNFLLIWEFLLVSLFSTYAFEPDKTKLFDVLYRKQDEEEDLKTASIQQEEFLNSVLSESCEEIQPPARRTRSYLKFH